MVSNIEGDQAIDFVGPGEPSDAEAQPLQALQSTPGVYQSHAINMPTQVQALSLRTPRRRSKVYLSQIRGLHT
jgi:hypothetical protein